MVNKVRLNLPIFNVDMAVNLSKFEFRIVYFVLFVTISNHSKNFVKSILLFVILRSQKLLLAFIIHNTQHQRTFLLHHLT